MREENKFLAKLLTLDEIYELFTRIGSSLITDIDLKSTGYSQVPFNNSIELLCSCKMVTRKLGRLDKTLTLNTPRTFNSEFNNRITKYFRDDINEIFGLQKFYDEYYNSFYIPRNFVSLQLSGLLMILGQLKTVRLTDKRIYILDINGSYKKTVT